jgi:hypothetical protein
MLRIQFMSIESYNLQIRREYFQDSIKDGTQLRHLSHDSTPRLR